VRSADLRDRGRRRVAGRVVRGRSQRRGDRREDASGDPTDTGDHRGDRLGRWTAPTSCVPAMLFARPCGPWPKDTDGSCTCPGTAPSCWFGSETRSASTRGRCRMADLAVGRDRHGLNRRSASSGIGWRARRAASARTTTQVSRGERPERVTERTAASPAAPPAAPPRGPQPCRRPGGRAWLSREARADRRPGGFQSAGQRTTLRVTRRMAARGIMTERGRQACGHRRSR
jgi:hypothetical protein